MKTYELTFFGAASAPYFPRWRRAHKTKDSAAAEALRVREILDGITDGEGTPTAAHRPILIFGNSQVPLDVRWPL